MKRIILLAAIASGLTGLMPGPSEARDCVVHGWRQVCNRDWPVPSCWSQRYCRRWERDESTRVYGYASPRYESVEERAHCLFQFPAIRATGDDKLEEERAQVSAQDRWAIETETRYGTRFADVRNAAALTKACVKKVPTTDTEKGQANLLGVRHYVCTVEAVPCAAPKVPVEEEDIAKRRMEKTAADKDMRKTDPRDGFYEERPPAKRKWYWRPYRRD